MSNISLMNLEEEVSGVNINTAEFIDKATQIAKDHMLAQVLDCLNSALEADYRATACLINNRVPANQNLCDHQHVPTISETVSCIGFINGVLSSLGLPPVCAVWEGAKLKRFSRWHGCKQSVGGN